MTPRTALPFPAAACWVDDTRDCDPPLRTTPANTPRRPIRAPRHHRVRARCGRDGRLATDHADRRTGTGSAHRGTATVRRRVARAGADTAGGTGHRCVGEFVHDKYPRRADHDIPHHARDGPDRFAVSEASRGGGRRGPRRRRGRYGDRGPNGSRTERAADGLRAADLAAEHRCAAPLLQRCAQTLS